MDIQTFEGLTPLHEAVKCNARKAVEILLRGGANPNVLANDGMSCLNRSCLGAATLDSNIVNLLLEHGANAALGRQPFLIDAIQAMDIDIV